MSTRTPIVLALAVSIVSFVSCRDETRSDTNLPAPSHAELDEPVPSARPGSPELAAAVARTRSGPLRFVHTVESSAAGGAVPAVSSWGVADEPNGRSRHHIALRGRGEVVEVLVSAGTVHLRGPLVDDLVVGVDGRWVAAASPDAVLPTEAVLDALAGLELTASEARAGGGRRLTATSDAFPGLLPVSRASVEILIGPDTTVERVTATSTRPPAPATVTIELERVADPDLRAPSPSEIHARGGGTPATAPSRGSATSRPRRVSPSRRPPTPGHRLPTP